jgi:hypothetical protein
VAALRPGAVLTRHAKQANNSGLARWPKDGRLEGTLMDIAGVETVVAVAMVVAVIVVDVALSRSRNDIELRASTAGRRTG